MPSNVFTTSLLAILASSHLAAAHMEMSYPPPFKSKYNPYAGQDIDYSMTSPLNADGSNYPCKGYQSLLGTSEGASTATFTPGQKYNATIVGGAPHAGGSCQFSLSYDKGKTFTTIGSIEGDCPVMTSGNFDFTIPSDAASGAALFAWSWFNNEGNREMYMNCASVTIAGGSSKRNALGPRDTAFSDLPPIFLANIGNQCTTVGSKDVQLPDPGPNLVVNSSPSALAAPVGSGCQAAAGGSSAGSSSGSSSAAPAASSESSSSSTTVAPATVAEPSPSTTSSAEPSPSTEATSPAAGSSTGYVSTTTSAAAAYSQTMPPPSSLSSATGITVVPVNANSSSSSAPGGGIFVTVPTGSGSGGGSTAAVSATGTTLATVTTYPAAASSADNSATAESPSATAATETPSATESAAAPSGTGSAGSGSGSASGTYAAGTPCSDEGAWNCIGGTAFQRCASGAWSAVIEMAAGTSCVPGVSDTLTYSKRSFGRRGGARRFESAWVI